MGETYVSSMRRQEILENIRKEREKRREEIEAEDEDFGVQVNHGFRSETIAKLVQERRSQDIVQDSKLALMNDLREEKELRGKKEKEISKVSNSPKQFKKWIQEKSESDEDFEEVKPKKREIKPKAKVAKPAKREFYEKKIVEQPKKPVKISISSSEKELKRENFDKRIDELLKLKEENLKNRELEKRQNEENELKKCSFSPQVTEYFNHPTTEKIEDRLMKLGQEQQKHREKVRI